MHVIWFVLTSFLCYFLMQLNASAGGGSSETEAVSVPSDLGDSSGAHGL